MIIIFLEEIILDSVSLYSSCRCGGGGSKSRYIVRYFHWATLLYFTLSAGPLFFTFSTGPLFFNLLFPLGHFAILYSFRWATLLYFTFFCWATLLYFTFSTYLYFFHFTILVFTVAICGKQLMQFNTTNKQRVFLQVYNLKQVI